MFVVYIIFRTEKQIIKFNYYIGGEYVQYSAEPYELRMKNDVWKVLIRNVREKTFEEIYLARVVDVAVGSARFSRREIPDEFGKNTVAMKRN